MTSTFSGATSVAPSTHRRRGHPWPFKAQAPQATGVSEFGVGVPRRQEVEFADGSRVWLERVEHQGVPDLFLRDVKLANQESLRIDLRHLVPELATDLPIAATKDVPGIVHYSLRGRFKGRLQLLNEAAPGSAA